MAPSLFLGDLRLATRNALRRPGFTVLVVLTLALGIGVNSAVFALLDGVLLRPLPYRDPSRLVFAWQTFPSQNVQELEPTAYDYQAWHALRSLSALAMVRTDTFTLTGGDNPERVRGSRMTASLMPLLGIAPRLGRNFTPEEDLDGTAGVAILSDGLWRRRFGADERVLGRIIQINGESRTIVGVMPRGASLPGPLAGDDDLWMPARLSPADRVSEVYHSQQILGGWALRAVLPLFAGSLPAATPIDIDGRVAFFTAAVSGVLGVLFGVFVAAGRPDGRLVAGLLFETRATDPATLAAVVAATMSVAVAAGVVPARRAMSVDPMIALRNE